MWHEWVLRFRQRERLTQAQAAEMLGVEERTVRRWEAGKFAPSKPVRERLTPLLVPSAAHRMGEHLRGLLAVSSDLILVSDPDWRVVAQSESHRQVSAKIRGRADMVGEDWRRWMPESFRAFFEELGGMRTAIRDGYVSARGKFLMPNEAGTIVHAGISDTTVLRLDSGVCLLSVTKRIMDPDFIEDTQRAIAANEPAVITWLDD